MARSREEIKVGLVVVIAAILFVSSIVLVGGVRLFRKKVTYTTYFKFAGGLEPGSPVRFGGLKVGSVQSAEIDPKDSTRIRIRLQVAAGTPLRANSSARISTLGFLGENYIEVSPGTRDAALLSPGRDIPATEIVQLADVFNNVNNVTLNANKLVGDLDDKFMVLASNANELVTNFNDVVSPENRQHLAAVLSNMDATLAELRPELRKTLANVEGASGKLGPALDNANATISRIDTLASNIDAVVVENRKEVHEVLLRLHDSLAEARQTLAQIDDLLEANRDNIDETLENFRAASQNLRQFTDTIKQRPFSLIRVKARKDPAPAVGK
jgi:phospholipid/cholesterol/gamma-HCH transport system substrate-binding protein